MLDASMFLDARWGDLYAFFAAGHPPLALRLLIINTIFIMLFIVRRARGVHPMRADTVFLVQGFLIVANILIMFGPNLLESSLLSKYVL
jgi:hypothetical protein